MTDHAIGSAPRTVAQISAMLDAISRNHEISQRYLELAIATRARIGGGANWCAFAAWASRQAGQTIRGEDLRQALRDTLGQSAVLIPIIQHVAELAIGPGKRREIASIVLEVIESLDLDAVSTRASDAVARGNLKVFAEIGLVFERFLEHCATDGLSDNAVEAFCSGLRDGEPPEGQRLLRSAFALYASAAAVPQEERAVLLFHANLLVGLHEQTRLQPEINEAMTAALGTDDDLRKGIRRAMFRGPFWDVLNRIVSLFRRRDPIDVLLAAIIAEIRIAFRRVMTAALMTIHMPGGVVLRLGHDLSGTYPPSLFHLTDASLLALLATIDPTPDSLRESGAVDWGNLGERMHFIAELFRTKHEDAALFE